MEIKTAEYARCGHPDRVCDIIADSILDECLKQDPNTRSAIEVFGCHGIVYIGGELTTNAYVDIAKIVKDTYKEIGYKDNIGVQTNIVMQSPEIKSLADKGAGDSGIVTGYATNETKEMLPLEVVLAKRIVESIDRRMADFPDGGELLPDGKVQVTIKNGIASDVVIAYQSKYEECDCLVEMRATEVLMNYKCFDKDKTKFRIIRFENGGFDADTGLTGRKNVLWYGPRIPIGGGSFAGKDGTKVDRSGAYLARAIAINEVKKGAKEALVEISFVIGNPNPLYVKVNGKQKDINIRNINVSKITVKKIIDEFGLNECVFKKMSLGGHFGCGWF